MCLIGKTLLLCMQCRGIGPHLVARGKSHGFSRVAAGTCGIFSRCEVDAHSKWEFVYLSLLTSSVEDRESALISRRYGVPGFFILLLY